MIPDILQIAETGRAEDLHAELRAKSDASLWYFSRVVMNYRDLNPTLHVDFCNEIQRVMDEQLQGFLMMRGSFKSTIRTKSYMLWRYLKNHEVRFLNVGASDTIAKKALIDIKWHVLNNQLLRWLYPELKAVDPGSTKWTEAEVLLPREGTYDEPTFTCDGINAKRTGFHYDELIFDDPVAEVDAETPTVHEAAYEFIQYSRGLLHDPEKSRRCFLGTRWKHGTADVFGKLMESMLPESQWYVRSAIEDEAPTFPERLSLATLTRIRNEMGDYKFNCQYMNRPSMPGSTDFEPSWIKEYDVSPDGSTIIPLDGTPQVKVQALLRMSFYDPSGGGKSAKCENAIVFGGMSSDRRRFILEAWGENTTIGSAVEHWHTLGDRWKPYQDYYEAKSSQKAVEDLVRDRRFQKACPRCQAGHLDDKGQLYLKNPHRRINPIPYLPKGSVGVASKEERIRFYAQKPFEDGLVYIRRGMTKLRSQIIEFPHGSMVDVFDATAYLLHLMRAPLSDDEAESELASIQVAKMSSKPRIACEHDYGGY